ncbi:NitT/TauT family transport system substrate-binding protein [Azospirillum lipoferum]|uniref:Nitrate ABC transporter substrate-binding protein n=1 Tax=Azospirillum lipoferum TaxID=193 RepID=A0A5A9GQH6_AZOLI|nr:MULTISPECIES: ABC transporter substrate-binding protein [Azospirillum]KAA0595559.1 nitrate ABC transporter substrate-binding protein [Azospirillum lipoferum]MCP1611599.1 NitT/TauT family transport system substrate-binding protein [Azospirillum lipoferum]MDW5537399.1 ABC transporter substrate-binding protein [Azospirillum sp. NL1]
MPQTPPPSQLFEPVCQIGSQINRRDLLMGAAALGFAAATTSLSLPAFAAAGLRVGYIPIIPMTQLYVLTGEGWAAEAGLALQTTSFQSGPAMIQALASGTLDVAYVGIGPAMIARSKGVKLKVVAANVIDQVALIGRGPLVKAMAGVSSPAEGIKAFRAANGRRPKIGSLPAGSVPDTVLRYWMAEIARIAPDDIEIVGMGEQPLQQALLSGAIDGASILEPILTLVQSRLQDAAIIAKAGSMFPKQPGAVLVVTEEAIAKNRDAVAELVRLHIRATAFAKSNPDRTAELVTDIIGKGLVEREVMRAALTSDATTFVDDPRVILESTKRMQTFQQSLDQITEPVDVDALFDFSFHDAAKGK